MFICPSSQLNLLLDNIFLRLLLFPWPDISRCERDSLRSFHCWLFVLGHCLASRGGVWVSQAYSWSDLSWAFQFFPLVGGLKTFWFHSVIKNKKYELHGQNGNHIGYTALNWNLTRDISHNYLVRMVALNCKSKVSWKNEPVIMLDHKGVPYPSILLSHHLLHPALVKRDLEHLPGTSFQGSLFFVI